MKSERAPVLVWFRNDLRVSDNQALDTAASMGRPVLCLFILEDENSEGRAMGLAQRWWLHHSLKSLGARLQKLGSRLILRRGDDARIVKSMVAQTGADHVLWNRRYDPQASERDARLKSDLRSSGITVESFAGQLLHEPSQLKTGAGGPFKVYTPFWRAFSATPEPRPPFAPPRTITPFGAGTESDTLEQWGLAPVNPDWARGFSDAWTPGEAGAAKALDSFIQSGLQNYETGRNMPGSALTSRLSPHLAMGEITPFQVWHATRGALASGFPKPVETFRKELVWREFAYNLLVNFPNLATLNFNSTFDHFPWSPRPELECAWKEGRTGYPIVDAGMRQLWQTGWMHNRVRMITASFLIKHLMIDWRVGEKWFWDTLVDACPANNPASWQWVAGSGADAAPYYRIFNPTLQGEKFDADGTYVRKYVPELAGLANSLIHRPWDASTAQLSAAGVILGKHYPHPVVDHLQSRERAMTAYREMRTAA